MPNFFWDSEPTLHPLYEAIREYLEIDPRIKVLNERCRVFLDLADILSDSIADSKMSVITWIIIVLIIISILVTGFEVVIRFAILQKSGEKGRALVDAGDLVQIQTGPPMLLDQHPRDKAEMSGLEMLAMDLGLDSNASLSDVRMGIQELKRQI